MSDAESDSGSRDDRERERARDRLPSGPARTAHEPRSVTGPAGPAETPAPIPMLIWCPECKTRHIDVGEFATKPHHTHSCQGCGMTWRPAIVPTVGVQFLPGFKND